jgi:peptidoglycan/LPS O-acetylase OafA/YrhL
MQSRNSASAAGPAFRRDIEGLRGLAILLVLAYHAGVSVVAGGYIGVDVFFVLSGYLITRILVQELESTGRINLAEFYARRIRRLLPALVVVIWATMLLGYWVYSPLEQATFSATALTTLLYISNLVFIGQNTDYLGPSSAANPLLHTWSLGVEEQFYLIWPLVLMLVLSWRFASAPARRRFLLVFFALVGALSFWYCLAQTAVFQPKAFFSPLSRAWEFALGGLAFALPGTRRPRLARAAGWSGLALIVGAAVVFSDSTAFPGPWALVPVAGTVGILYAGTHAMAGPARWLDLGVFQVLGRYSYALYLWHWPLLMMARTLMPGIGLAGRIATLGLAFGLAVGSYRLIENPIRRHPRLVRRPLISLLLFLIVTIGGVEALLQWSFVIDSGLANAAQQVFANAAQQGNQQRMDCMVLHRSVEVKQCVLGNPAAATTLAVFGDSHVLQWLPALERVATANDWRVVTFIKASCSPADIQNVDWLLGRRFYECEQWRESALGMLAELNPDMVVVSAKQWYLSGDAGAMPVTATAWRAGMQRTLGRLTAGGRAVIYVRDTPIPGFNIPECLSRQAWQPWIYGSSACTFARDGALHADISTLEQTVIADYPSAHMADFTASICPQDRCQPEKDALVIYRDDNHLSAEFAAQLAPEWQTLLASLKLAGLKGQPTPPR